MKLKDLGEIDISSVLTRLMGIFKRIYYLIAFAITLAGIWGLIYGTKEVYWLLLSIPIAAMIHRVVVWIFTGKWPEKI